MRSVYDSIVIHSEAMPIDFAIIRNDSYYAVVTPKFAYKAASYEQRKTNLGSSL